MYLSTLTRVQRRRIEDTLINVGEGVDETLETLVSEQRATSRATRYTT